MKTNKCLIFFFAILTSHLYAQQIKVTTDFGFWIGVKYEKKIFKSFDLDLEQQIRTFKNSSVLDDYLFDIGLKYPINKEFNLATNIRYTYNNKRVQENENNFRYNLDFGYKKELTQKSKIYYRLRYQKEYINHYRNIYYRLTGISSQNIYSSGVRNKLKIKFKLSKKIKFYTSAELFRLIENFREPYFNKIRFNIGDEIKSKIGKFDFLLGFEKELHSDFPYSFLFFKMIYSIKR
jgi:hypothetical protein